MNQPPSPALEQAVAALRAPALLPRLRDRPLPEGIILLLQIAAGNAQATNAATGMVNESEAMVVEAAEQFIQQVMFSAGSDSYRVLGLAQDAEANQIKEHYRWLVRWVHPDRRGDDWNHVYTDRVTAAWQELRTAERRAMYDKRRNSSEAGSYRGTEVPHGIIARPMATQPAMEGFHLSARAIRRLPAVVLGGLLLGAVGLLGLQAYVNQREADNPDNEVSGLVEAIRPPLPARLLEPSPAPRPAPIKVEAASRFQVPLAITKDEIQKQVPARVAAQPDAIVGVSAINRAEATVPSPAPPAPTPARGRRRHAASTLSDSELPVAPAAFRPSSTTVSSVKATASSSAPDLVDEDIANELILQFRSAYASGNINQVRALLANDDPKGKRDRKRLLKEYMALFASSTSRRIEINNATWTTDGDTAVLVANFHAYIVSRDEAQGRWVSGDIRFDLRQKNGGLRIVQLRHEINPG